jgi:hypothetical protein
MKITENTMVSISVLTFLCGGIYWLSNIALQTQANAQDLSRLSDKQSVVEQMATDIAVIKEKIIVIERSTVRNRR